MFTVNLWMCLMIHLISIPIKVQATSLAHNVFLPSDRSSNPFSDRFTQRVINMDRNKLYSIRPLTDEEFLSKLARGDDILSGLTSRTREEDLYELVFDDKLDDQLTLQDNIDGEWVHLMTAGPLSVNYVGNLLVLASKRDFPLTRPPNFPFQHIKHPDSFRATLAQVSGSMYSALLGAHTTMDRIQLNVQQVPGHVKTALQLVIAGSPSLIELLLPKTLESIGRIANESASYARTTFEKFSSLQELIAEIIEASANTHSTQSSIVEEIHSQIDKGKEEQVQLNNNINDIQKQYEIARLEMEKALKEYQDAENAIPTARIKKKLRKFVKKVVSVIVAPAKILGCILGLCYTNPAALDAAIEAAEAAAAAEKEIAKQNAIAKANFLLGVLKEAEKRHAAFAQQQAAEQQKLTELMKKIAALDLDKMSEQEIVDILIESILQMNQIKEQWGRLIQFFSKLSIQAESTQQIIVHELIGAIHDAQAHGISMDPNDREFFIEVLKITCHEVERGAHLLYVMSKTYYDISSEYMIDKIASMNTLLLLQTDTERSAYLRTLSSNITATSTQIVQLGQERQNEYTSRNKARREDYEKFLTKMAEEDLEGSIG